MLRSVSSIIVAVLAVSILASSAESAVRPASDYLQFLEQERWIEASASIFLPEHQVQVEREEANDFGPFAGEAVAHLEFDLEIDGLNYWGFSRATARQTSEFRQTNTMSVIEHDSHVADAWIDNRGGAGGAVAESYMSVTFRLDLPHHYEISYQTPTTGPPEGYLESRLLTSGGNHVLDLPWHFPPEPGLLPTGEYRLVLHYGGVPFPSGGVAERALQVRLIPIPEPTSLVAIALSALLLRRRV